MMRLSGLSVFLVSMLCQNLRHQTKIQGRITQLHITKPQKHALSATCYLHSKCSMIKRISQLPAENPEEALLHWLWMGKTRTTKKVEGPAHAKMFLGL